MAEAGGFRQGARGPTGEPSSPHVRPHPAEGGPGSSCEVETYRRYHVETKPAPEIAPYPSRFRVRVAKRKLVGRVLREILDPRTPRRRGSAGAGRRRRFPGWCPVSQVDALT
jgi:hypothetical protein